MSGELRIMCIIFEDAIRHHESERTVRGVYAIIVISRKQTMKLPAMHVRHALTPSNAEDCQQTKSLQSASAMSDTPASEESMERRHHSPGNPVSAII